MRRLGFAALALVASAALAKPLYITVPRAYGTGESPVVELAFAGKEPVELRILKPKSLEAFLGQQLNLRRAYAPPSLIANPGRALSRGLNQVAFPGDAVLDSLRPDFRKAIAKALPTRNAPSASPSRLKQGAEKIIGIPEGMSVVRTEWLNLDLGGDDTDFTVPGFDAWSSSGSYQERKLALGPLPAGLYVLQMVQGMIEGQVVLVVSDLSAAVKQTDTEVLVRVAGRDQLPKAGVEVAVRGAGGAAVKGRTDANGEVRLGVTDPRLLVTAALGEDTALVDTDFYSTLAVVPDVFLYSDRPVYRPGDEVKFRGVVRQPDSFLSRLFKARTPQVSVMLLSEGGKVSAKATLDEFGCFSGSFKIPSGLDTGVLRLTAQLDARTHQSEARVQEYVKPTFYLELESAQETVTPGEKLTAKVRARRYAGGAPKNAAYEVFLYRVQLDAPAWVDDVGMGGKGSAVTYGTVSTTEGALSVPQRLFSSLTGRGYEEDPWKGAAKFDASGEAEVSVEVPALSPGDERKGYRYSLSVRARDDQGTFANGAQSFFLASSDLLARLKPLSRIVRPGGAAAFAVRASTLSGKPYGETAGKLEVLRRSPSGETTALLSREFKTDAEGRYRVEVPGDAPGAVEATVTLRDRKGQEWSGTETVLVLGSKGEQVVSVPSLTLESLNDVLEPGDRAEVVALLPKGWGPKGQDEGALWLTLTGGGLHRTEKLAVKGLALVHQFEIEPRFGSAVYAALAYPGANGRWEERSVPLRIIPSARLLNVQVTPQRAEAQPLTEQTVLFKVTDAKGNGRPAQLSVGVVDKAVYAIAAEFRPRVLDFFYPLVRDNVSTFYSSEFQGYGYGDRLAALTRGLPAQAFAAVKPPNKPTREQDTAYWNPAVVTDRDGFARVSFKLPSNQTLWTVTAVAADASGRFGEATAEFATRGSLNLAASLPQFLREGDVASGSVRLSKGAKGKDGTLSVAVTVTGAAAVSTEVPLATGDERLVPVALNASSSAPIDVTVDARGVGEPLREQRRVAVRESVIEEEVSVGAWGGGRLTLPLPPGATVRTSTLQLMPGVVDAALSNLHQLLEYPHGCVEQLVATTVPNLAVYRTLEKVGALAKLDPQSAALLTEARSRAVQGTSRILDLAVKGGGFVWFSGESKPSLPMTLIALDGLAYAVEAGLVDKADKRLLDSAAWLDAQKELPPELAATRTWVLSRLFGPKQAPQVRALLSASSPGDLYSLALTVLAAENAGIAEEAEVKASLVALVEGSRKGFFSTAAYAPPAAFFHYPLRRAGYLAVLGHAASKGSLDVDQARRRTLELLTEEGLSTFDRSRVLLHSQWLLARDAQAMRAMAAPTLTGTKATFAPMGVGQGAQLERTTTEVTVGAFEGMAQWRAVVRRPLKGLEARSSGMTLGRTYAVLRGGQRVPLNPGDAVTQGEEVFVELTLDASGEERWRNLRSAYTVLEDAIPAGFVPLQEDKAYRGAPYALPLAHEALKRRALSPTRAVFYFEEPAWWSAAPRSVGYVMRAQFPGTFVAPPATLEDMYASAVGARTASAQLSIAPSAAGK